MARTWIGSVPGTSDRSSCTYSSNDEWRLGSPHSSHHHCATREISCQRSASNLKSTFELMCDGFRATLSRNVDQPDHILANPIMGEKAKRRPGPGEICLAVTKHDGVQV